MVVRKTKRVMRNKSTGAVTYQTVDPIIGKRRFYIGSSDIANGNSHWPVETYLEAVDAARKKCAESRQRQIIVEVIAVIDFEEPPVRVTRLR